MSFAGNASPTGPRSCLGPATIISPRGPRQGLLVSPSQGLADRSRWEKVPNSVLELDEDALEEENMNDMEGESEEDVEEDLMTFSNDDDIDGTEDSRDFTPESNDTLDSDEAPDVDTAATSTMIKDVVVTDDVAVSEEVEPTPGQLLDRLVSRLLERQHANVEFREELCGELAEETWKVFDRYGFKIEL